jgi:hypothetical protein
MGSHSCYSAICDIAKVAKRLDKKCGLLKVLNCCFRECFSSLNVLQDRLESTAVAAEQLAKVTEWPMALMLSQNSDVCAGQKRA